MDNKKIKNATKKEYNGIQFKSLLEVMVYKTLLQKGFEPHYEASKYVIWKGFKPEIPCYKPNKQGILELQNNKIIDITYTPDFIFMAPDDKTVIIMEIKGFQNDTYPLKEKMFRGYLENLLHDYNQPTMFFQIKNKSQLLEAIDIINTKFGKNG
jgi:hypothetical protein